ncbi:MAG: flagellar protein FliS [Pirellulaceae bacterium]|nr:flagellar protein FliS [Pirellulaceae bacterium]
MQHVPEESNPYLYQEVMSASPLRLRWMLIQRAEELCGLVRQLWDGQEQAQGDGWLLRIRDILGELLGGVCDSANPVSRPVADFYVYLIKLITEIESDRDRTKLQTLQELLHLENETWEQVVRNSMLAEGRADIREGNPQGSARRAPIVAPEWGTSELAGGFSLEI